ncbi:transmembrane signal receptor [Lithospermum erythrorhizon]|uniref:Transmembrane signal receptor n=1 Tax=Lithospermum erythrorhizon TaxID=34254 RepID=A0AAV3PXX6_LITER
MKLPHGMSSTRPEGLFLCQQKYAIDIIAETGLLGVKPSGFPIEQNHRLTLADGAPLSDPERYQRLVGRLIYLAFTRPDLAYIVHILAQFMQQPRQEHWEAALRVVRYLKWCPGQGILLHPDCDFVLSGGSPISWKTKKQDTVSRLSAEAEYRSMCADIFTKALRKRKSLYLLRKLGICDLHAAT